MSLTKRLFAVILAAALVGGVILGARPARTEEEESKESSMTQAKETLYFWYTDETLTDFLSSAALEYYEQTGYKIVPQQQSGLEYLEEINHASIRTEEAPDLYIATNDLLEKAYLAGLASPVQDGWNVCSAAYFPQTALDAVTYRNNLLGYPFYYETSVFLFNKTYMEELAKTLLEQEADKQAGQEAQQQAEAEEEQQAGQEVQQQNGQEAQADGGTAGDVADADNAIPLEYSEEELEHAADEKIGQIIPATIEDILSFADEYDAPPEVEAVFKWDVADIFYNYFFIGDAMIVGGSAGDNPENIDVNNQNAVDCLSVYQNLNQFFSIDAQEVSYDSILQEFIEGKIVFTVATTDAIGKIEQAKTEGKFAYDYGVAVLPNVSATLPSKSLSVTNAVVVNGYSEHKEIANDFAKYLTVDKVDGLYARCGKVASLKMAEYENANLAACMQEYENSVPMPKMLETSNFWVQLEICFTKIWEGEDIAQLLENLEQQLATQVNGNEQAAGE